MKSYLIGIIIAVVLLSCSETYEHYYHTTPPKAEEKECPQAPVASQDDDSDSDSDVTVLSKNCRVRRKGCVVFVDCKQGNGVFKLKGCKRRHR